MGRWAFHKAMKAGQARAEYVMVGKEPPAGVAAAYAFWDFLVLRNLRRMLGMDKMRRGGTGAAPISPELLKWYWSIGVPLIEGYGMTENAGIATINTLEHNAPGTVGHPVPGVEMRIAEDGEIQTMGLNNFQGYWRNNEKTAETYTSDGWLRTGDVGRVADAGYLIITGRIKDLIICSGYNVYPRRIEEVLYEHPAVEEVTVIGIPDDYRGEAPKAFIKLVKGVRNCIND